jgi:ketosteroid isomerase-like protein
MSGTLNGKPFANDGVDVFEVSDERIARKDTYGDWIAYARQVGLEPLGL